MKPGDPVVDQPVTIDGWSPRNSSRKFLGQVDLRNAFAFSINTVAAQLGEKVGFDAIADMARRFGITTPINTHPSMVLGTSDVHLIEMTRAFAEISNNGVAVTPYGIIKISTPDGTILYQHTAEEPRVLVPPAIAAEMTDMLQTAVNTGTARNAQIGRPVAGKTGTTSSNKDGWFLGFSSGLTTGVWMGRDDAKPLPGLGGGGSPARAFSQMMQVALRSRPAQNFQSEVTLPEWQLEPDEEAYYGAPDQNLGGDNEAMPQDIQQEDDAQDAIPVQEQPQPGVPPLPRRQPAPPPGTAPRLPYAADRPTDRSQNERQPQIDQKWLDNVLKDKPRQGQSQPRI
jgi:penicillin-binding protein 1A